MRTIALKPLLTALLLVLPSACGTTAPHRAPIEDAPALDATALAERDYVLGVALETGQGTAVDLPRAARAYARACRQRHGRACNNLGVLHDEGRGVPRDRARAAAAFEQACAHGAADGCFNDGMASLEGTGRPQDPVRGAHLMRQACEQGHADGCINAAVLALELSDGGGALRALERGCALGAAEACRDAKTIREALAAARRDRDAAPKAQVSPERSPASGSPSDPPHSGSDR